MPERRVPPLMREGASAHAGGKSQVCLMDPPVSGAGPEPTTRRALAAHAPPRGGAGKGRSAKRQRARFFISPPATPPATCDGARSLETDSR